MSPRNIRLKAMIVVAIVAVSVIVLDQWTKSWAVTTMRPRMVAGGEGPIMLAGSWLQLIYTENTGAAFSLGTGVTWIFSLIAIIVVIVIIRTATRLGSMWWAVALGGLLGGAIGNLIDRVAYGHVIDFLDFHVRGWHWPAFNVADSAITVGAILFVLDEFRRVNR